MKHLFFALILVLFRVVAADVKVSLPDESIEFSSIIITAPQTANSGLSHTDLELPKPMRKYKAEGNGGTEPFGYGSLFTYNTDDNFGDISIPFTHRNILKRLKEYKEVEHKTGNYKDSNLLLIRVKFSCINSSRNHSFECFFGLFSSGVTKKSVCKTISQTYAGSQFHTLNEPLKREFVGRLLLENKLLHEYCLLDIMQDVSSLGYDADVYPYKLFKLNGYSAKRVIFSNADYVKSAEGFNKNLIDKVRKRLEKDLVIDDKEAKTYFGCTKKDLFNEDKIGPYFNQSEQSFLNSLESNDVEAFFGSTAPRMDESLETLGVPDLSQAQANSYIYDARVDMYSYRDICVVCRGCIAMILNNGWLTDNIKEAVSKRSGVEKFVIKPIEKV